MNETPTDSIFPSPDAVPTQHRLEGALEQRDYLCDGVLRQWDGPRQDVLSPVCEAGDGGIQPVRIGSYPLLTERQALQALDAACRAYDHGRGAWPTMSVEQRIRHVKGFAAGCRSSASGSCAC